MKFLKIFLCVAFIFTIAACHGKKDTIYEYPDEDSTSEGGNLGDPCKKNDDCKDGLFCINKVCSKPAADEDIKDDSDTDTETEDNETDSDINDEDADTGTIDDSDTDTIDDSDSDTNDEDEPDDSDTQPDGDNDETPYLPECGNGITEMGEECDNGFANSDEPGTYNSTCRTNCRFARCGDGITDGNEACDDGNRLNGDYCSADCSEIIGYCGDGKIQVEIEKCDNADPNVGNREGIGAYCAADCSEITGSCGDGIVQRNEACDNAEPGEGGGQGTGSHYCSDNCKEVTGYCGDGVRQAEIEECDDGTNNGKYGSCNTTCSGLISCGDGIVQPAYEKCDDGNNVDGDYCSADCQTSHGACGDGIKQDGIEECDTALDPYCSSDCQSIVGNCGDGEVNGNEECDKASLNGNTGCSYGSIEWCEVCSRYCTIIPGTPIYCGDGIIQAEHYEACDDGNNNNNDYCSADCQTVTGSCGDGIKQNNEACDTALDPYCSADCKRIEGSCGDGDKNGNEECDYGTNNGNMDCAYDENCKVCTTECKEIDGIRHYCGDHHKDEANGEKCDDGELNGSYDHCSSDCKNLKAAYCGDGITQEGYEDCDNGEGINGTVTDCAYNEQSCKLCNSECKEFYGNTSFCGDGKVDEANGEACDKLNDPYCSDNCQTRIGSCGDGIIQRQNCEGYTNCTTVTENINEACDDGNTLDNDYCSPDCSEVTGSCGDGIQQRNENCDDGDNNGKYNTTHNIPYCNSSCSAKDSGYCGDTKIQNSSCGGDPDCTEMPDATEECDYGSDNGKTDCAYGELSCMVCNSQCKLRNGETSVCGDGKVDSANNEACDDGNNLDNDYCSADCSEITGYCGDGIKQDNEECDDGNNNNNDYCSYNCQEITGYCGDGIRQLNEVCDNADFGYGEGAYCSFNCQERFGSCGDGIKQDGIEVCDKAVEPYCNDNCSGFSGSCGDGTVQRQDCEGYTNCTVSVNVNEACDDGNNLDGDYCSADCSEVTGSCGDETKQDNEECDDGTYNGTYNHCNDTCNGYMERCGDTTTDGAYGEICDEGDGVDGHNGEYHHCSSDCTYIMECGDGRTQSAYGEKCDDGDDNGKYNHCSDDCKTIKTGYCGDGKLQRTDCSGYDFCYTLEGGDEECDYGNANGSTYCNYGDRSCEVCTESCTPETGKPAYCGDKKIQKGTAEACDAYVAVDPENRKLCDDDITENCCEVVSGANENCDDGEGENGNGTFGKCDETCSEIVTWECGDGEIAWDHGETCDSGSNNGKPGYCNSTCNGPTLYCGDSRIQREDCGIRIRCDEDVTTNCCEEIPGKNEACDHGSNNGQPGYCHSDCTGWCGDGILQKHNCDGYGSNCVVSEEVDEACDDGRDNGKPGYCNQICSGSTAVCGNGTVEYGEACDDGNTLDNDYCSADCQTETGRCGDGIKQDNETCDEEEENNGYHGHCNKTCDGTSSCGDGELGRDEYCDGTEMISEIQCSYLPQFGSTPQTKIINSCTSDCVPVLTQCEYNDSYKSPFLETGQTKCFNDSAEITCPASGDFYGQEPEFAYTAHNYETIANGEVVKDNSTGLMWQRNTPDVYGAETGLDEYGYQECAAAASCTTYEANAYCFFTNIGGYDDWRLPTAAELSTIADYSSSTHIYSGFTNTNGSYWTDEGLLFSSTDGTYSTSTSSDTAKIKCVRSVSEGSNCTSLQCREKTPELTFVYDSPNTLITLSAHVDHIVSRLGIRRFGNFLQLLAF